MIRIFAVASFALLAACQQVQQAEQKIAAQVVTPAVKATSADAALAQSTALAAANAGIDPNAAARAKCWGGVAEPLQVISAAPAGTALAFTGAEVMLEYVAMAQGTCAPVIAAVGLLKNEVIGSAINASLNGQ